jgi:hypothetical protein
MRRPILVVAVAALAAVAVAADPPKLGPEWTYDKEMKEYTKKLQIKVTRSAGGNVQGYHLDLRDDKVVVYDTDGNIASGVTINGTISLDVRKGPKGSPGSVSFGGNGSSYHDIDGDGVWDAWSDARGWPRKRHIWRDGGWVQVCDSKAGFGDGPELSLDRKTEYVWDGKKWTSRPATGE